VESFTIDFNDLRDQSATLNLIWEKTRVPVKLEVDTAAVLQPKIEAAMASTGTKSANLYYSSALFYFENGKDMGKALEWVNEATRLNDKAPNMMLLKARILAKRGDKPGAIAAAKKTAELGVAAEGPKSGFVKMSEDLIASLQ
jgi:Flp pilus assembly protein TadD